MSGVAGGAGKKSSSRSVATKTLIIQEYKRRLRDNIRSLNDNFINILNATKVPFASCFSKFSSYCRFSIAVGKQAITDYRFLEGNFKKTSLHIQTIIFSLFVVIFSFSFIWFLLWLQLMVVPCLGAMTLVIFGMYR
ncbi:unnamed protein product [Nippostrongylus brasiliensis]|uniref:PRA1 family protein n=1 Tax=Nippostrongylus brasiliensis TaxID=27835 RepID=A0A0N4XP88_NIPBR|nr:unnamed protein product [Nippostrongylus brasiliensis]